MARKPRKGRPGPKTKKTRPRGRPRGTKNLQAVVITVQPSRCPRCGSTRRSEYWGKTVQEYAGIDPEGRPYTHIIRRRCRCLDCGQVRIDKTYENRPD